MDARIESLAKYWATHSTFDRDTQNQSRNLGGEKNE